MKVLLVDDDVLVLRLIKASLGEKFKVFTATSAKEGLKFISEKPDLAIIDLDLEERMLGLSLIAPYKKIGTRTVVVSSYDKEDVIDKCYEEGCDLFYSKGEVLQSIHVIINDLLLKDQISLSEDFFTKKYITTSDRLKTNIGQAFKALLQSSNILITGETGTGKSELSKLFHEESKVTGEFVAINCASIPKDLLESELFGHTKGAFTGADKPKTGKLKLADNGVLFLDEINSMTLDMQAKLLKAVEEKRFYPVGSERVVESQFKLITASNENLFKLVTEGRFRLDLLQRLCGTMIDLPSLRDRTDDVFALVKAFNTTHRKIFFAPETKAMMSSYQWPGNTREVKRFVEFCLGMSEGKVTREKFEEFKKGSQVDKTEPTQDLSFWVKRSLENGLDTITDEFRTMIIEEVLKTNGKNVTSVMKDLQISTRQFYKHVGAKKIAKGEEHELQH